MTEGANSTLRRVSMFIVLAPIRFYRDFISPLFPPVCRFDPTCSTYARDAIVLHGPWKGLWLAIKRVLRCHPIHWLGGSEGYDPVPPLK